MLHVNKLNNLNIQWVTQDPDLFELDWLKEILQTEDIHIVRDIVKDGLVDKNTLVIGNHAVDYRYILEGLRESHKKYGVFLLSDENLIEPCEWLHDPSCLFSIRNYVNPWLFGHPKVTTLGLGFKRGFNNGQLKEKSIYERKYWWCFAGTPHGERGVMTECFEDLQVGKIHYCSGFNATDGLAVEQYASLLNDSVFALCPPGQDSMDSFRLYEALEAGCIPVALKRTERVPIHPSYWHAIFEGERELPFVLGDSWQECREQVDKARKTHKVETLQIDCQRLWVSTKEKWKAHTKALLKTL